MVVIFSPVTAKCYNEAAMKIAYITPYEGEKELVTQGLEGHEVVFWDAPIDTKIPDEIADAEVLSLFVNSRLTEAMVDAMPNLQVIALRSTGYDHVPVAYAQSKGIKIGYVPHYGSQTVAEHAFALMLGLSRRVHPMYELLRRSGGVDVAGYEGFDLCGKTLGVIGTGAIGRRVIEIAQGFRMEVVAHDLYPDEAYAVEQGFHYLAFPELLHTADIVTFHVPATADNHHMLNAETLGHCKSSAYVINTARGTLIDTVALMQALQAGQLAGAGLDVFEGEEYLKDEQKLLDPEQKFSVETFQAFVAEHELLDMPNVIMTPHMAFNTKEAKQEITDTTVTNILNGWESEPKFVVPKA